MVVLIKMCGIVTVIHSIMLICQQPGCDYVGVNIIGSMSSPVLHRAFHATIYGNYAFLLRKMSNTSQIIVLGGIKDEIQYRFNCFYVSNKFQIPDIYHQDDDEEVKNPGRVDINLLYFCI